MCYNKNGDTMNLFPTEEPDYTLLDRSSAEYRKARRYLFRGYEGEYL